MEYIHIEYCEKWNYKPEFDRVSKIILSLGSDVEIIGNKSLPRTGSFEVSINGELVFSKFKYNTFPVEDEIISWFK